MKKSLNVIMTVIMMMVMSGVLGSCNEAGEELDIKYAPEPNIEVKNEQGYSIISITDGKYTTKIEIQLAQKSIAVDRKDLGKSTRTFESDIAKSEKDSTSVTITRTHKFSDTQSSQATGKNWHDPNATFYVEAVDITCNEETSSTKVDEEGNVYRIIPTYPVKLRYIQGGNELKTITIDANPWYLQTAKDAKIDDKAIVSIDNQLGSSTADVTVATDASFTSKTSIKLAKRYVYVDKDQFGKLTVTSGTPSTSNINNTDSIGNLITATDKGSDGQVINLHIRNMHHKNAEWWYAVSETKYVDYKAELVNDSTYKITLNYNGKYSHSKESSKSGSFAQNPYYYQILKAEPQQLTYQVDTCYIYDGGANSGSILYMYKITRSDGKKFNGTEEVAWSGNVAGRNVFGVTKAEITDRKYSSQDWPNLFETKNRNNCKIETTAYKTYRYERYFASSGSTPISAICEFKFVTSKVTFTDPDTGWTLVSKEFTPSVSITKDEIGQDSSAPSTLKDDQTGHTYSYLGTHTLSVNCKLNNQIFHKSTGKSNLYKY